MKILLIFESGFDIDKSKLTKFFNKNLEKIKFDIYDEEFDIEDEVIIKPKSFKKIHKNLNDKFKEYSRVFCFTIKNYDDFYFFHEYHDLTIFSFSDWNHLTNLPLSNGVVYFIVDYISLDMDTSGFRHNDITGCIYDFLKEKRGVDDGMRQARICPNCLERISTQILDDEYQKIFDDLITLMNELSSASKWNKDVLEKFNLPHGLISKRKGKSSEGVNIVIASPGDTKVERKLLLGSLERRFRVDNHENHCGKRIMVHGWEDLASQNGYAQDVINEKIIEKMDFVVAVFKHKLGTPTKDITTGNKRSESGTSEELLKALDKSNKNHPIAMCFFHSQAPVISLDSPDKEQIEREWNRLQKFKKSIEEQVIYKPYTDSNDLLAIVLKDIEKNIIDYII